VKGENVRNIAHRRAKKQRELALPAPSPTRPSSPLARLRSDMDRLFEGFFHDPWGTIGELPARLGSWTPEIDIMDGEREVTVRAEIPGIDPSELEVTVSGDVLTISGQKKEETEEKGKAFYRSERRYGAFRRSMMLPAGVEPEMVTADYDKGILTVRIPKTQESVARRIDVSSPGRSH
jgi:HSP20 family protein